MSLFKKMALGTFLIILGICLTGTAQAGDAITLRWSHFAPEKLAKVLGSGDHGFIKQVEEKTNGRIKIQIHWGGTLGKENENLGLVRDGTVDIASFYTGAFESQFPLYAAPNAMFFVMTTLEEAYQCALQMPQKLKGVQDEIAAQNIKLLYHILLPSYVIYSREPIVKFEDLKGLKLRTFGVYLPQAYKAAGAVGVTLMLPELHESLQRGVVDGVTWSSTTGALMGLHKVAPNVNRWDIGSIVGYGNFINLDTWNKISPADQKIIMAAAAETQKFVYEMAVKSDALMWAKMKKEGAKIHEIPSAERDKWITASPKFLDEWVERLDKQGKGKEAREMRDLWLEIVDKY